MTIRTFERVAPAALHRRDRYRQRVTATANNNGSWDVTPAPVALERT